MPFILDIMQVSFVTVPIANIQSQLSWYGHTSEPKQCYEVHAFSVFSCRYLGSKWGGPVHCLA